MTCSNGFQPRPLKSVIDNHILDTLAYFEFNRTFAARSLGISIRGMRLKIAKLKKSGVPEKLLNGEKMVITAVKIEKFIHLVDVEDMEARDAGKLIGITDADADRLYKRFFVPVKPRTKKDEHAEV